MHAPAALRNRAAIGAVLAAELPESGVVLEVASGSGEHAVFFAERFPQLEWQPSDMQREALASIIAYWEDYEGSNLRFPAVLDATNPGEWELSRADAAVCINMVHISPLAATEGLFAGCGKLLAGPRNPAAPLILYGPYFEQGVEPAPSNVEFDRSLRARDPSWGIRNVEELDRLASCEGFTRTARHEMPANNLVLVYRRD